MCFFFFGWPKRGCGGNETSSIRDAQTHTCVSLTFIFFSVSAKSLASWHNSEQMGMAQLRRKHLLVQTFIFFVVTKRRNKINTWRLPASDMQIHKCFGFFSSLVDPNEVTAEIKYFVITKTKKKQKLIYEHSPKKSTPK